MFLFVHLKKSNHKDISNYLKYIECKCKMYIDIYKHNKKEVKKNDR